MKRNSESVTAAMLVIFSLVLSLPFAGRNASAQGVSPSGEDAYRANNLGVAYLEQFEYKEAAAAFRRALALDPQLKMARIDLAIALFNMQDADALKEAETAAAAAPQSPQPQYILGLIAKNENRTDDAIAYFKKVLAIDPADVGSNVNLGQIYVQQRKYDDAVTLFRAAIAAEPYNSTALYNLASALLRSSGGRDEGQRLMSRFQTLRQSGAATSIGQNYLEQGRYAEAIVSTGAESELVDKTIPKVSFQNAPAALPVQTSGAAAARGLLDLKANETKADTLRRFAGGAVLIDLDGDGDLDLAKLNSRGGISLFRNDKGKFTDITRSSGDTAKVFSGTYTAIVAGDFNNDGMPDLFISGYGGMHLFRNAGKGRFTDVTAAAKLPEYSYLSLSSAFVDADHDGDLDIFIAGFADLDTPVSDGHFAPAPNLLLRNNGDGTFLDISKAANVDAAGNAIAVIPTDYDNRRDVDLLIVNYDAPPKLFRNLRDGSFRDVAAEAGLDRTGKWTCAAAGDLNKDSFIDLFFGREGGPGILAMSDGRGKFVLRNAPSGTANASSAQILDYDNDGLLDLIVNTDGGLSIQRNTGDGWMDVTSASAKTAKSAAGSRQLLSADIDADGDEDLFVLSGTAAPALMKNSGGNANASETIRLQGRNSNRTGIGAKIDLRAGSLAQKLETYSASPSPAPSDIQFGLGKRGRPDAVRVIWPSGVIQAETSFSESNVVAKKGTPFKIEELDRKPSSCPYLYTWNGERFEFITDFLGGGEMGDWTGPGSYHYPDPDEFVRIPPGALKPKNGRYELRVTNELEEVLFVDHMHLVAVEHDAGSDVYPNEGMGIPTAGKQIMYTTRGEHPPVSAVDSAGKNVLARVSELDHKFYDSFRSVGIRGYSGEHSLTLDLDNKKNYKGRTLLLLTGWTDYAFSSDNIAASQSGKSLFLPKLQVKNERGEWQTVIDEIGISIGRPQTLVVDVTGKFLTGSREVRIVTNFETYWDKIAVDTSEQTDAKTIDIAPADAILGERGFSKEIKFGQMVSADYDQVFNDGRWKYFSGNFTKLGDVKPLLDSIDDVFVISKTGDELVLSFPALPDPPAGKAYTFMLYADGYSKEMDINSGSPETVFPLPFRAMTKYPYGSDEQYPMTGEKREIYDRYTTRVVRGFLPRVEASVPPQR